MALNHLPSERTKVKICVFTAKQPVSNRGACSLPWHRKGTHYPADMVSLRLATDGEQLHPVLSHAALPYLSVPGTISVISVITDGEREVTPVVFY